jgi:hypothetical protein
LFKRFLCEKEDENPKVSKSDASDGDGMRIWAYYMMEPATNYRWHVRCGSSRWSSGHFFVKAVWDPEAKVFYSQSDIVGLHIEADTIDEFEDIIFDTAIDLIVANHA